MLLKGTGQSYVLGAVEGTPKVASEMMHAFVDSGPGRWAKRQD